MANALQKMAAGHVVPVVDTEIGFDEIGTALARMESRDVFGKIILRVA
jgi:alcohol dehydrogenase